MNKSLLKKHYMLLLAPLGLVIAFTVTRLYNLLKLPIFTDEAIYVRWAQHASSNPVNIFISMTDGKQPLPIWIMGVYSHFLNHPLGAARLVSVTAGLLTMIGIGLLTYQLFNNKRTALIASALYIIFPFALVYDRLALYDSLVATTAVWALLMEVLLAKHRRLDIALVTSMVIGVGLLTKSSAFLFLYLLPFSLLLFDFSSKSRKTELIKLATLSFLVFGLSSVYYSVLRLSPYFSIISEKNDSFVYSVSDWISHPTQPFFGNIISMTGWLMGYVTIPILVLSVVAFIINKRHLKEKLLLLVWFAAPFVALALLGKVVYPRYIFFMTIPLLILAAYGLVELLLVVKRIQFRILLIAVVLVPVLFTDYYLLTDFSKAPIPQVDRSQLLTGYASGVGVSETISFLEQEAKAQPIYVATASTFGLMPQSLEIYLGQNPNIEIKGYWPVTKDIPVELQIKSQTKPTYVIFYAPCDYCKESGNAPSNWPLEIVFRLSKQDEDTFYTLYRVVPN